MKTFIFYTSAILIFAVIMVGGEFKLYPFKVKLNSWTEFFGWVLLIVSIANISNSQMRREYKRGYQDALKDLSEFVTKKLNSK